MDEKLLKRQFGTQVRKAREKKGLSQEALARAVGYSRTSITNIELGNQNVNLQTLYQLASALDVEPRSLLPAQPGGSPAGLNPENRLAQVVAELTARYVKRENKRGEDDKELP